MGALALVALLLQTAGAGGSSLATLLGSAAVLVGIYGFLLLAYRDLLKAVAKLEDEPARREAADAELAARREEADRTLQAQLADSIALLREDLNRQLSAALERVDGLEERERRRLEGNRGERERAS